jgi:hypothetical protein
MAANVLTFVEMKVLLSVLATSLGSVLNIAIGYKDDRSETGAQTLVTLKTL